MVRSIFIEVAPEVLKWLRVSSGYQIKDVSKRLRTPSEIILDLRVGKGHPH
ncbi:MAG: hypothetical protein QXU18_16255 [Thermoplasmatales archaeon]